MATRPVLVLALALASAFQLPGSSRQRRWCVRSRGLVPVYSTKLTTEPASSNEAKWLTEGPFDSTMASFSRFVETERWLADRTLYLPRLADDPQAKLFTRPRRFGKTLLVDMLAEYLDVNNANRFDELFGRFAVGGMTPGDRVGAGEYFVLRLDFSEDDDWKEMVRDAGRDFAASYPSLELTIDNDATPSGVIRAIRAAVRNDAAKRGRRQDGKLAILIDEYDTPFNKNLDASEDDLMRKGGAFYESLEEVKSFYSTLKSILSQNPYFRVYITGVASLTLSGLTSGFNIDEDISMRVTYDTLCGLEEDEVREGLRLALLTRKFGDGGKTNRAALRRRAADAACESNDDDDGQTVQGGVSQLVISTSEVEDHVNLMEKMYNGYQFSNSSRTRVYNPTMVAAYLAALTEKGFVEESELRQVKIELPETAARFLASRTGAKDLLAKLVTDNKEELPDCRMEGQLTPWQLRNATSDAVTQMLLFQFGAATFWRSESGDTVKLRRPNENVRRAILQQLLAGTSEAQQNRLRTIMGELMSETLSSHELLPSVREFVKATLNFEAIGTPIANELWESGGRLEADFQSRLMTVALMSAELAHVRNVRIEARTNKTTTDGFGYYDIILGSLALELKVTDKAVREKTTAAKLAEVLASDLNVADVADVWDLPDDVLLRGHTSYKNELRSASKQAQDYKAEELGVRHKFAVLQILPNRALAFAASDAIVQNGDDLHEDVQVVDQVIK